MAVQEMNQKYPRVFARITAEQHSKLEGMAQVLNATPARVIRLLIDKAQIAGAPQIVFDNTGAGNSESASICDADGAPLYSTQSAATKRAAHRGKR